MAILAFFCYDRCLSDLSNVCAPAKVAESELAVTFTTNKASQFSASLVPFLLDGSLSHFDPTPSTVVSLHSNTHSTH